MGLNGDHIKKYGKTVASIAVILFLILSLVLISKIIPLTSRGSLRVSFLNVGWGDSAIIITPENKVIVVDGGNNYNNLAKNLKARGVKEIDLVILSHPHKDHLGGLVELVDRYPVKKVVEPAFPFKGSELYTEFLKNIRKNNIKYQIVRDGDRLNVGDVKVDILAPEKIYKGSGFDANNSSIVTKIRYKDFDILMTGDVQGAGIKDLKDNLDELPAEIIKISHHGEESGTPKELLIYVDPKEAIISTAPNNSLGFPEKAVLDRLKDSSVRIWRTDFQSDIELVSDGKTYEIWSENF